MVVGLQMLVNEFVGDLFWDKISANNKGDITSILKNNERNLRGITEKNHTHVKKVGQTSEFCFGVYWWTWKQLFIKKNCWSGLIKM